MWVYYFICTKTLLCAKENHWPRGILKSFLKSQRIPLENFNPLIRSNKGWENTYYKGRGFPFDNSNPLSKPKWTIV